RPEDRAARLRAGLQDLAAAEGPAHRPRGRRAHRRAARRHRTRAPAAVGRRAALRRRPRHASARAGPRAARRRRGGCVSDSGAPPDVIAALVEAGARKAALRARDLAIRGALSGAILGLASTLATTATLQTGVGIVGAALFPIGFVLIVLLGLELVTGN